MNLNYLTLRNLTEELRQALEGKQIIDACLLAPHDLYLKVKKIGYLLLSASPTQGRITLFETPEQLDKTKPSWIKHTLGAQIETVCQYNLERIVEFQLVKRDWIGSKIKTRLICEIMGRNSNILLVSEPKGRILGALRHVTERMSRHRKILPGKPYRLPPQLNRIPPNQITWNTLNEALRKPSESLEISLVQTVAGLDLFTAQEFLFRAGIDEYRKISTDNIKLLLNEIQSAFSFPSFIDYAVGLPDRKNSRIEVSILKITHIAADKQIGFNSVSEAIRFVTEEEKKALSQKRLKLDLEKFLTRRLSTIKQKIVKIETDLKTMEKAKEEEKFGHLLMANLFQIPQGASKVTLDDLFNPSGLEITIPLRTHKRPIDNAKDYLKQSQKAKRSAPILGHRLKETKQKVREIQKNLKHLKTLDETTDLFAFRKELERANLIKKRKSNHLKAKKVFGKQKFHPRQYQTSDGWIVLVGRNRKENDQLTKSSSKKDIFLHAHGCPGSHVILKHQNNSNSPSYIAIEEAARLAAYWSKARGSKVVPVNYTEIRYVQKPRGAPPGIVNIRNEKTVFVQPKELEMIEDHP